jgi:hypothetical protein
MPEALTPPNLVYVETRVGEAAAAAEDPIFSFALFSPKNSVRA